MESTSFFFRGSGSGGFPNMGQNLVRPRVGGKRSFGYQKSNSKWSANRNWFLLRIVINQGKPIKMTNDTSGCWILIIESKACLICLIHLPSNLPTGLDAQQSHHWPQSFFLAVLRVYYEHVIKFTDLFIIYIYTWNPNDPCFDWKRRSCRQNKGQMGSKYAYIWYLSLHTYGCFQK